MKKLIIALTVVLNVLLVACTSEKETSPEVSADYATLYNETMKNIIANDSSYAEAMTQQQVIENNIKVFNELKKHVASFRMLQRKKSKKLILISQVLNKDISQQSSQLCA